MSEGASQPGFVEEYRTNLELWKHHDNLRQARNQNLLTANTILVTALGAVLALEPGTLRASLAAVLLAVFGLVTSSMWKSIARRNAEYVRLCRLQLLEVERSLPGFTTFRNIYEAMYLHKPIAFAAAGTTFQAAHRARGPSTAEENHLPTLLGVFWLIVLLGAVATLVWTARTA